MGKVQSKQGECFLFNAHFNPVCQIDDDPRKQKISMTSPKFCSELSLSLCEVEQVKPLSEKCPLKVILPPKDSMKQLEMEDTKREKAEEEKSEKEEKKNVSFKEQQAENTEFSFTLYDFNGNGQISNDDVERIVGHTISEALEKSLNLSSSNHTIQVHLAISPEKSSKNKSVQEQRDETKRTENEKPTFKSHCISMESLNPGNRNRNKYHSPSNKKTSHINSLLQHHQSPHPHHKSRRKFSLTDDRNPACINKGIPYEQQCSGHRYSDYRPAPGCLGHQSHHLDLAGIDDSRCINTCLKYDCHGDEAIRTNICSQTNRVKDEKLYRHRRRHREKQGNFSQTDVSPHMFRRFNKEQRCNHIDVNSDLCDLVPEERFDWEHNGRSKSFDLHKNAEYLQHDSPKPRRHTNIPNGFPAHHHCHKHKEQEKEPRWNKLTKWMEKDFTNKNQRDNSRNQQEKDQCKHHHIHEHIHHHYHHYVNS